MNPSISMPSWKDRPHNEFVKVQIPVVPWRSFILMPRRMRRKLRSTLHSRISPASSIASLQTSFSPKDTLRSLQSYRWSVYDFQYLLLTIIGIFSLTIVEGPGPLGKTAMASLLMISLLLPITRQFFLPFLPIASWLFFFYACQYVNFPTPSPHHRSCEISVADKTVDSCLLTGVRASGFAFYRQWRTSSMGPTSATSCQPIKA